MTGQKWGEIVVERNFHHAKVGFLVGIFVGWILAVSVGGAMAVRYGIWAFFIFMGFVAGHTYDIEKTIIYKD